MNLTRLEEIITEQRWKKTEVADALGISFSSFHRKMKGETPFTLKEIKILKEFLNLSKKDLLSICFNES